MSSLSRRLVWSVIATDSPMGQQKYEHEIQRAIRRAATEWSFELVRVGPLRSHRGGVRRHPTRLAQQGPSVVSRAVGSIAYRTVGPVHRFDLRLPAHFGPEVITIHDLPPLRYPDEGELPATVLRSASRAQAIITPTTFAAAEITQLLPVDPDRVHVIPYGLSDEFRDPRPAEDADLLRLGISGPFVIHAAGATARKNLAGLASAWSLVAQTQPNLTLVLAGPHDERRDTAFAGLPRVNMVGALPAPQIAGLMCRASLVVVPSLYEGFGLPALEGMACATPVVAAQAGALPEVCGEAALLVAPDAAGIAQGITMVLGNAGLAARLRSLGRTRARSFSWDSAAKSHLEVYFDLRRR